MFVYIATNKRNNVLYVGVTNDVVRRGEEHKFGDNESFTHKYRIGKIVYVEECQRPYDAIAREKQLKRWSRKKKFDLIRSQNPEFADYLGDFE